MYILKAIGIEPYYRDNNVAIFNGNCKEILPLLSNIDAVVTDPPYGLTSIVNRFSNSNSHNTPAMNTKEGSVWARKAKGFMGKEWDGTGVEYDVEMWQGCFNALKSGGHLLAFGGTRTYHRMACAIEDAGFEIRDMIEWVYGSGFPKSLNIGKAIDKIQGNERIKTGEIKHHAQKGVAVAEERGAIGGGAFGQAKDEEITKGNSEWEGWGTALKPAHEPICMARKPIKGTVAENVLEYGTGGINIDGCRVELNNKEQKIQATSNIGFNNNTYKKGTGRNYTNIGRFPANLIHDGSEEVLEIFPNCGNGNGKGAYNYSGREYNNKDTSMFNGDKPQAPSNFNDNGSAARFFYCAKASKSERDAGCEELSNEKFVAGNYSQSPVCKTCDLTLNGTNDHSNCSGEVYYRKMTSQSTHNNHPTVKPLALMEYLIKLITPPKGIVLDPFMGSGSTLIAARKLGYKAIGIELNKEYADIAVKRLAQGVLL